MSQRQHLGRFGDGNVGSVAALKDLIRELPSDARIVRADAVLEGIVQLPGDALLAGGLEARSPGLVILLWTSDGIAVRTDDALDWLDQMAGRTCVLDGYRYQPGYKQTTPEGRRLITVWEDAGSVVAGWFPKPPGMPVEGRGQTVLEAIGELCVYEPLVELGESCEVVDRLWSIKQPSPPRRR